VSFSLDISRAACPGRDRRAKHGIDGSALGRVRFGIVNANIHIYLTKEQVIQTS
jgi:hypothetical protein